MKIFVRAVIVMTLVALSHVTLTAFLAGIVLAFKGVSVPPAEIWAGLVEAGPLMMIMATIFGAALLTAAIAVLRVAAYAFAWVVGGNRGVERLDDTLSILWVKLQ